MPQRSQSRRRRLRRVPGLVLLLAVLATGAAWSQLPSDPMQQAAEGLRRLVPAVCPAGGVDTVALDGLQSGFRLIAHEPWERQGRVVGWRARAGNEAGDRVRVDYFAPGGSLRRLQLEYHDRLGPRLLIVVGPECRIGLGRAIEFDPDGVPRRLLMLDADLRPTGRQEPLDARVPDGTDPGGVLIGLVDSGVNYLLPEIAAGLARDEDGHPLGYDFWDDDTRPFDSNPVHSPFFPQRHGTRTASILLREAPAARLVVYRYPRPDMDRMADLVAHAARRGVRVVNLSLGSGRYGEWRAFADAAARHPEILFVASAGNDDRDLDRQPVYPAALDLDNLISVTSGDVDGGLAGGSNWGAFSVDLIVPGEQQPVLGFDGTVRAVSGSSYAAPRVSALAARLLDANPDWNTGQLRKAVLALANAHSATRLVSVGHIVDPAVAEYPHSGERFARLDPQPLGVAAMARPGDDTLVFEPFIATVAGSGWTPDRLATVFARAAGILRQCDIALLAPESEVLRTPDRWLDFDWMSALDLMGALPGAGGRIVLLRDTRFRPAFGAMTLGTGNTRTRPPLRHSVWVTRYTRDAGVALAHELVHLLVDTGLHVSEPGNLMQATTTPENVSLSPGQCREARRMGRALHLLR